MTKIELTKTVANFVVGASTTHVVTSIIKNQLSPRNKTEEVELVVGSMVIGSMVADASKKYTGAKIDEMASWWKTNVTKN